MISYKFKQRLQIFLLSLLVCINYNCIYAQNSEDNPTIFLGLGTGINNYTGLIGVTGEGKVLGPLSFFGTIGAGGWGYKIGGGLAYYPRYFPYGPSFSLGYSIALGATGFETEMEIVGETDPQMIEMDLKPAGTINLLYTHNWQLGKRSKFCLNAGYALPLNQKPYDIITPNVELTEDSEVVMNVMQPGGVILGIQFLFGL